MIYDKPPKSFISKNVVAGCHIRYDNTTLMMQFIPTKYLGGKWGNPAGKINNNEDVFTGLEREVWEETNITLLRSETKKIGKFYVQWPDREFIYHLFTCELKEKPEIVRDLKEHQAHLWCTLPQALALDLIPDEDACVKKAFNYYG